jgi:biotin transport system permease protein
MHSLYSERQTWLHSVPAGAKLVLLALLCTGLFWLQRWEALLASTAACALLLASLGRAALGAWRMMRLLAFTGLLIVAFHAWLRQPLVGVGSALRLLCTASLGTMLTLSTRHTELLEVFEFLLAPLSRFGVRPERLALQLGLMLRFVEHFFVQWTRLDDAYRARSGRAGGWRLLGPLTIQMLVSARRVADALQLRLGR